jgi:holin-like protein
VIRAAIPSIASITAWVEFAVLCGLWWLADRVVAYLHWPLPSALFGLFALLLLFALKIVRPDRLRRGSALLLRHLLLFFIPPMMVLRDHADMWGWLGVKLLAIVAIGTIGVMSLTGLLVQFMMPRDPERHDA